ncbi:MAG: hypothetical protein ACYC9H_06240 [Sulfuricaulis sp.]
MIQEQMRTATTGITFIVITEDNAGERAYCVFTRLRYIQPVNAVLITIFPPKLPCSADTLIGRCKWPFQAWLHIAPDKHKVIPWMMFGASYPVVIDEIEHGYHEQGNGHSYRFEIQGNRQN